MSFSHTLTLASSFVSPRGRRRNRLPPTPLARCLPGLHAQSLRQRPHQASPAPEGVRADGHRGRRRDERALLPDRAGGGRGGSSGSSCRIMSPTRSRCTWCTRDRRSCPSSCGASRVRRVSAAQVAGGRSGQALCAKNQRRKEEVATSLAGDHSCMTEITQTCAARLPESHWTSDYPKGTPGRATRRKCYSKTNWTP